MLDYNINLAREQVRTTEERLRFYKGMLVYLSLCSIALIFSAYIASVNIQHYLRNNREGRQLLASASATVGVSCSVFNDPDRIYADLQVCSEQIVTLKNALEKRVQLLPIIHNLFENLPDHVDLQRLSASRGKITFGLVMPPPSDEFGDPVRLLTDVWKKNPELMTTVSSIRPITGERRTKGTNSMFFVQFECLLNE